MTNPLDYLEAFSKQHKARYDLWYVLMALALGFAIGISTSEAPKTAIEVCPCDLCVGDL